MVDVEAFRDALFDKLPFKPEGGYLVDLVEAARKGRLDYVGVLRLSKHGKPDSLVTVNRDRVFSSLRVSWPEFEVALRAG